MDCEVTSKIERKYVRVTAAGEYSPDDMPEFIGLIRSIADKAGRTKALIDCRQITGDMTEAERFRGGQIIAEVFGSRLKAALVMPAAQITKLGELAAVNRGARLLVTDDESEAIAYLLAP